ncbi:DUF4956 domain-containing protein [Nocardioides sp. KR10-350]|uniref:DUF4956 domain-containing protein n=1 Tax=Nocardioides cheoyonin TaxID=3156615 RepID=UPI0032B47426
MLSLPFVLADLVAVVALVAVFWWRNGRRELVVAYLTVNIGVLAVTGALANSTIGAGLGLGLFGILSIIRLRSEELSQREVAYYFANLALGLVAGLDVSPAWLGIALMALVVVAVVVGDHPRVSPRSASQEILLDRAQLDRRRLVPQLETMLGARVVSVDVLRVDIVNDTTLVRVRVAPQQGTPARAARETPTDVAGSGAERAVDAQAGPVR